MFAAGHNTPGYSPDPDNVHDYDTASEAWDALHAELAQWADETDEPTGGTDPFEQALQEMESMQDDNEPGTVYSPTPNGSEFHDLGIAWWVHSKADLG